MKRDQLDHAIDQVAARLTHVDEDDTLAARISSSLPERRGGLTWLLAGWAPRLAMLVLAAFAVTVVLRTFDGRPADVLRTFDVRSTGVQLAVEVPEHRTYVEPTLNERRTIVERPSNDRRTIDVPDFDRSLAAVAAPRVLTIELLSPASLAAEDALAIAPLAIADLALTAESFPPR